MGYSKLRFSNEILMEFDMDHIKARRLRHIIHITSTPKENVMVKQCKNTQLSQNVWDENLN